MMTAVRSCVLGLLLYLVIGAHPGAAQERFDLAHYRELKANDRPQLEFILVAMHETVFYAQGAVGGAVVCASPAPIAGADLVALVEREIATPSNPLHTSYSDEDRIAFVLMNGLKNEGACR